MNQLDTFTVNPFYTITTAKDSIQEFSYDVYCKLKADGRLAFAAITADTKTAWEAVFGNLEDYDADLNQRQNFTKQVTAKMKEFIDKVIDLSDLVSFKFKKDSGAYQLFFPHGHDEYHHATHENVKFLMKRWIDGTHTYATELGIGLEAEFTTILNDFNTIYGTQKEKKGDVTEAIPDYEIKVHALYDQLFKDMLVVLTEFYRNPTQMLAYFDETIVNYVLHHVYVLSIRAIRKLLLILRLIQQTFCY